MITTCGTRYEIDQMEQRAETLREVLGEIDNVRQTTLDLLASAEQLLTDYVEEIEAAIPPPWEEISPQIELPIQEKAI